MEKKILIADDHFVVIAGTKMILENYFNNTTVDYAEDYSEVLEKLQASPYDLIILDINMPGNKQKKMITEIKLVQPNIKILVFSAYDSYVAIQYIKEGADGYLNKLSHESEIIMAVKEIFNTGKFYSQEIIDIFIQNSTSKNKFNPLESLSDREKMVYNLLIKGYGNLEISNELSIHVATISTYKRRIFRKLGTNNLIDILEINRKYSSED